MKQSAIALVMASLLSAALSAQVLPLQSPAAAKSSLPNLAVTSDGRAMLSWVEPAGKGHSLRFATRDKKGWSKPKEIARGDRWFVNWADFPSVAALPGGRMAAHWMVKSAEGTYDYDVHIAQSSDGGDTWSKSLVPHLDGKKAEHGFVSLLPANDGALSAVWLDGREMKGGHDGHGRGAMTLRYVEILGDGKLRKPAMLDARVCECCQTSATMTDAGPVVVYRDRSQGEVRDIGVVRRVDGVWTKPVLVCRDGWNIAGCPVNGPSVAASGKHVAVAWFTAAESQSRVKLALSHDAGASFGDPIMIDKGNPVGRVEVVMRNDGQVFICWLTHVEGAGAIRTRSIAPDGTLRPAVTIAPSGTGRRNGFPQMVCVGNELVFAWTNDGVKMASMPIVK
ncbi:MAG: hypothetical protein ACI9S9_003788 [Planctomycetota bacterium]|jgi:hypothetical protein